MTAEKHNPVSVGAEKKGRTGVMLALGLAVWAVAAWILGEAGVFQSASPSPLRPVAGIVVATLIGFFAAWNSSRGFRRWILSQDLVLLTAFQGWRVVGFVFLPAMAFGHLPGFFAWPAGLGDVAVGLAAPFVAVRLARDPAFAQNGKFLALHLAGLLDFVVALGSASLASGAFPALVPSGVTSSLMEVPPLGLFPSFIVPVFLLFHLAALMKRRDLRRADDHLTAV